MGDPCLPGVARALHLVIRRTQGDPAKREPCAGFNHEEVEPVAPELVLGELHEASQWYHGWVRRTDRDING